ncbi:hypothetical protein L3X38_024157 [Prunus dulcis]|uniref:Uncharacterized protein n=1 Tax=Prunus dulcis TaxID=3755 RepID=A0AAD4W0V2_PRUDU|nr:hypothetical protein L3X38_024157 [Prunus dulcis]
MKPWRRKGFFRFESMWTQHEDCESIIANAWNTSFTGMLMYQVCEKIKTTRIQLMQWQRSMFGTTKTEIQRVRSQLDVVWRQPNSENTTATYHLLMSQLDSLLSREQAFWKQRSKVSWLKEGDRNTRFFHQRARNRKQRNYVKGLRNNTGRWREDEHGLQYVVLDYFTHLFTSSASGSEGEIIDAVESRVTPDMNNLLLTDYCDAEIHEAVFQM